MRSKILTVILTLCVLAGFSGQSSAAIYEVSYSGWFTLYDAAGNPIRNLDEPTDSPMLGWRTAITGIATWDDVALIGTDSLDPFRILGGIMNVGTVNAVAIGDGFGGPGNLVMGNTLASWAGFVDVDGIPINNVGDLSGLFNAIKQGVSVGDTVTGGALPASNDTLFGDAGSGFFTLPLGPSAFASTFFNVTPLTEPTLPGALPSGGLPIVDDGIPGSPILATFFAGRSGAFDLVELEVISITTVPVPTAIWLFISGFAGLLGFVRHRSLGS